MPYYKEGKIETWKPGRYYSSSGASWNHPFITKMVEMVGYRSGGPRLPFNQLVPDHLADPYAHFLNSARDRKFDASLKARGLSAWILPVDTGHNFYLQKREVIGEPYSGLIRQNGLVRFGIENGLLRPSTMTSPSTWESLGTPNYGNIAQQMYVSAAPRSEVFDLANFVGELREGLPSIVPSLMKGKASAFKNAGSDYLNVQFGWIPFVNDLINAGLALKTATEVLSNPSSIVRRSRVRKPTLTSTEIQGTTLAMRTQNMIVPHGLSDQIDIPTAFSDRNGSWWQVGDSGAGALVGSAYWLKSLKVERWFDGQFVQLPKVGFNPDSYLSRLDQLVNTKLTPETLWNLAPWSWLVDWHLRIGDSIAANLLAADDRVNSVYAYAMQRTTDSQIFSASDLGPGSSKWEYAGPRNWGTVLRTTVKQRVRANPYGFTAGGADALNESQLAILAALGLTKAGR